MTECCPCNFCTCLLSYLWNF
uniref:Uncharacterized protein n=1 Tax=Arundo donax TaxID=35708 RepID=A0A0A8YMC9_ARUDO